MSRTKMEKYRSPSVLCQQGRISYRHEFTKTEIHKALGPKQYKPREEKKKTHQDHTNFGVPGSDPVSGYVNWCTNLLYDVFFLILFHTINMRIASGQEFLWLGVHRTEFSFSFYHSR